MNDLYLAMMFFTGMVVIAFCVLLFCVLQALRQTQVPTEVSLSAKPACPSCAKKGKGAPKTTITPQEALRRELTGAKKVAGPEELGQVLAARREARKGQVATLAAGERVAEVVSLEDYRQSKEPKPKGFILDTKL